TPIPDPYVNQLGDLLAKEDGAASAAAGNFNYDLGTSTGVFFDGVYSDWFKLQTIALMAVNPSATAWNYQDSSDNGIQAVVGPRMLATVRRNFYLQTANQYFQTYSLFNVPSYVSDSEAQNKEGLSNLKSFSWSKRVTLGGGVGNFSDYNFVVLKNNPKSSWGDAFGNALMGAPSATDGSGNLNLNQNLLYDSGIFPIVKSSSY
ncbi:MAG TPA: hypothetical protein VK638_10840, partial [Edaphobacter sp.]|nr:hypothetical protein [Edaphobacter sp.]